ncbi:glycosyltransferase family 4 protein [Aestuariivita sp.]|uniref:glycosyltransferase family 4 protein n=1 Tax=Aestuariivita sp. TaxID=1872407 RepID=UPI00217025A0|nr:glycosyltransferase family 4 protein [Aestuariivita sp.]MCE8007025.1 glycosyltransferase family 4 protein [Aestuariivita sp.]
MPIVVISSNAGTRMGGEAIKAFQFFDWLRAQGADVWLVTHARNRDELVAAFGGERLLFVEDTAAQRLMWRSRVLSAGLLPYFHLEVARLVRRFDPADTVLHYLCPISPVEPRFPPRGYRTVIGPLNGNIVHPPGFLSRVSFKRRLMGRAQRPVQVVLGAMLGDKRKAGRVLNSGGTRTRVSLGWAGVAPDKILDVLDSGVNGSLISQVPVPHMGRNAAFLCMARLVEYKAIDLVLRALAVTDDDATLTVLGDGPEMAPLRALARDLNLSDRVAFEGYVDHQRILDLCQSHRALVFPSLAEANGIAMQEAMAVGLPVIALNWGGQAALGDLDTAIMLDPGSEDQLISDMAAAMSQLAGDAELANAMATRARDKAVARFGWDDVAASWTAPYSDLMPPAVGSRNA